LQCPDSVIEKVLTEIEQRESRLSWRERLQGWLMLHQLWKMGATAAAVVALVVIAVFYLGGDNPQVQQITFSSDEVKQARHDIELTLAYVHYYTKKTGTIVEQQLASTETTVRQPVQTVLEHQLTSAHAAVRQPVQMVRPVPRMIEETVKETFTSIFDGGTL
jgi:carbohydrate-binding DOMON domain-containing protein